MVGGYGGEASTSGMLGDGGSLVTRERARELSKVTGMLPSLKLADLERGSTAAAARLELSKALSSFNDRLNEVVYNRSAYYSELEIKTFDKSRLKVNKVISPYYECY